MSLRILLSGGGTAGSVTPLLAVAEQVRRLHAHAEFRFVGTANGPELVLAQSAGIPFETIAAGKLRRYWSWQNITDAAQVWRGYRQAQNMLRAWRPDVVVSAGSFSSVPVVWAAHRAGIPTLVHQLDVRPGLANRLMIRAADVITVTFQVSAKAFPRHKVHWTGNPIRPEILSGSAERGRELFGVNDQAPILLVLGGGTGSDALNAMIGTMAPRLVKRWHVIHVTGPTRNFVELHDPHYQAFPFLTWQMPHALAAADVVVSRAGLGTISELSALQKASILIPMPSSHQEENAAVIAEASAAVVIQQHGRTPDELERALEHLREQPGERARLGNNINQFYNPEALNLLVDYLLHLAQT